MGDKAVELPVLRGEPVCPAAFPIRGTSREQRGVVCQVMRGAFEGDAGVNMSAGQLGVLRDTQGGVYLNLKSDPSTVTGFCHGDAVPVVHDGERDGGRASYTYCPVWQSEKERIAEGRSELLVEPEPEAVSMGVSSADAEDPWQQARQDLDILAPEAA